MRPFSRRRLIAIGWILLAAGVAVSPLSLMIVPWNKYLGIHAIGILAIVGWISCAVGIAALGLSTVKITADCRMCEHCGYDVSGVTGARHCPECGSAL